MIASNLLLITCLFGCFVVGFILGTDFGKNRMAKIAADKAVNSEAFKSAMAAAYKQGGLDTLALIEQAMTTPKKEDNNDDEA